MYEKKLCPYCKEITFQIHNEPIRNKIMDDTYHKGLEEYTKKIKEFDPKARVTYEPDVVTTISYLCLSCLMEHKSKSVKEGYKSTYYDDNSSYPW